MNSSADIDALIRAYEPRRVSDGAAEFARQVVTRCAPGNASRAKALLFATSRLGEFAASIGVDLVPEIVLHPSVIERFILVGAKDLSGPTRRTLRTNLRFVAAGLGLRSGPAPVALPRERAKPGYSSAQIAAYLSLADNQSTVARAMRAAGLICLGAGAGLMGSDLRALRGIDVVSRSGGMVVCVAGPHPRIVPVLVAYQTRLGEVAAFVGEAPIVGGADLNRRNVTSGLIASLAGGADLDRIDLGRLRSTWLAAVAMTIGLRAFMDAAGIVCSQRLGDIVAGLPPTHETRAVAILGGASP